MLLGFCKTMASRGVALMRTHSPSECNAFTLVEKGEYLVICAVPLRDEPSVQGGNGKNLGKCRPSASVVNRKKRNGDSCDSGYSEKKCCSPEAMHLTKFEVINLFVC